MKTENSNNNASYFGIVGVTVFIVSLLAIIVLMGQDLKKARAERDNYKLLYELSE